MKYVHIQLHTSWVIHEHRLSENANYPPNTMQQTQIKEIKTAIACRNVIVMRVKLGS